MSELTEALAQAALSSVVDPVFSRPMIAIGTLTVAEVKGGAIALVAKLPAPSPENERRVRDRVESSFFS